MRKLVLSVVALAVFVGVGCDSMKKDDDSMAMHAQKSLYERLGGQKAVTAVVDDFVNRAAGDPKVNFTRKGVPGAEWAATPENVTHLKSQLVDFVTQATGGPAMYKGKDMKSSHANMQITNAEFDAIAGDLKATLDKFNVPAKEQGELLAIVGSTRKDIVTKM
jgi:hemoglobin